MERQGMGMEVFHQGMSIAMTDVEGSTALWEWNSRIMNAALALHDHTLRSLLPKYFGYEVSQKMSSKHREERTKDKTGNHMSCNELQKEHEVGRSKTDQVLPDDCTYQPHHERSSGTAPRHPTVSAAQVLQL